MTLDEYEGPDFERPLPLFIPPLVCFMRIDVDCDETRICFVLCAFCVCLVDHLFFLFRVRLV